MCTHVSTEDGLNYETVKKLWLLESWVSLLSLSHFVSWPLRRGVRETNQIKTYSLDTLV